MSSKSTLDPYDIVHDLWSNAKPKAIFCCDPGWGGGYCIIDGGNGKIVDVVSWNIRNGHDHSGWQELYGTIFEIVDDLSREATVFSVIEDTHHRGLASNKSVSSIDRKIGLVTAIIKHHQGWICSWPHLIKKPDPETFQKQNYGRIVKGINLKDHPQHTTDACCLGLKFLGMMNAHALVIKL